MIDSLIKKFQSIIFFNHRLFTLLLPPHSCAQLANISQAASDGVNW